MFDPLRTGAEVCSAMQNQRDSPLLRMPPEIRNRIYDFALGGNTFVLLKDDDTEKIVNKTKSKNALALLAVSRQLYAETALLPFSLNVFSSVSPSRLRSWASEIQPVHRNNITALKLVTCFFKVSTDFEVCSHYFGKPKDWIFSELPSLRHIHLRIVLFNYTKNTEKDVRARFSVNGELLEHLLAASSKEVKVGTTWEYLLLN
jgi:hypothetical protein